MKVLFAGGGTGGHVVPAIAIADALKEAEPSIEAAFVGTRDKIESRVVPRLGYPFHPIRISGFRRRLDPGNLLFPAKVMMALMQTAGILRRERPSAVVGTGGYVAGPVLLCASLCRIPTLLQEQNSVPGLTTRLLSRFADEVHVSFPETARRLKRARRVRVSGNPVRMTLRPASAAEARAHFGLDPEKPTLLVFGGSLGAAAINGAVREIVERSGFDAQILWQTGAAEAEKIARLAAGRRDIAARAFIDEMDLAYAAADLVVCRAGATTVAELTLLGKASILIPYPHAAADHQRENARVLAAAGAALLLPQEEIGGLEQAVRSLLADPGRRAEMERSARTCGHPDAARTIAAAVLALIQQARKR